MDKEKRSRFMDMIHDEIGEDHKLVPIIASLMGMVQDDSKFEELFEIHEGVEEYGQYLTEREAKMIVDGMQNWDGSRGAKWTPPVLFNAVQLLGGEKAAKGKYNCWALYVLMNMMSSDYGDAIQEVAKGDDYALTCYRMSLSWMKDKDHRNNVREYFLK
jgi:hypothetical protein